MAWFTLAHRAPAPRGARAGVTRAAGGEAGAANPSPLAVSGAILEVLCLKK